jgi:D-tyrosyl-tRNA(Tyr) deacylase
MKVIIQRVNFAEVEVNSKIVGKINKGLLIYVGFSKYYSKEKLDFIIKKILTLKLFMDENNERTKNIQEINGEILIISNFTLFGNVKKGKKINFNDALKPELAKKEYDYFITKIKEESNLKIETGIFGAYMKIKSEIDGPLNLVIEK